MADKRIESFEYRNDYFYIVIRQSPEFGSAPGKPARRQ